MASRRMRFNRISPAQPSRRWVSSHSSASGCDMIDLSNIVAFSRDDEAVDANSDADHACPLNCAESRRAIYRLNELDEQAEGKVAKHEDSKKIASAVRSE